MFLNVVSEVLPYIMQTFLSSTLLPRDITLKYIMNYTKQPFSIKSWLYFLKKQRPSTNLTSLQTSILQT